MGAGMIVQKLHEIQHRDGYLRREAMEALVEELRLKQPDLKLRHLHEVASFFPHFRLRPPPAAEVHVCRDMACHLAGFAELTAEIEERLRALGQESIRVRGVSCLGQCDRAPAVRINDRDTSLRDPRAIADLVVDLVTDSRTAADIPRHVPEGPPDWQIDIYRGKPTYEVVRTYARDPDPARILGQTGPEGKPVPGVLERANLLGLGGPGQRSWLKWQDVYLQPGPEKFIVCNADESEPGTFKDREILRHAPHLILEGMILAGLVVGAQRGFVYIRHEYEPQIEAVRAAIREAYRQGVCGEPAPALGKTFHLEVFVSPGGYICGEMTALIEAMEDRRGEPRNRPPELQVKGLRDKPTLVSNVETFAWVPYIVEDGGERFARAGVNGSKGRRLFSVSGDVNRPGVYEVPIGTTLRALLDRAGGTTRGLKALATSGPSGGFLPARLPLPERLREKLAQNRRASLVRFAGQSDIDVLDLELDIQVFRDLNLSLGAAIVVYGEGRDMADQALNCSRFFAAESCGKCVPCRLGSRRLTELAARLKGPDRGDPAAIEHAAELVELLRGTLSQTSICGLGQVAPNPLATALRSFREDFLRPPIPPE
jgi:NADH:ubiquinone oxidoreductase subunit F (NADH-binding)/NADH:ubiquinone oxidoreductase subunit E